MNRNVKWALILLTVWSFVMTVFVGVGAWFLFQIDLVEAEAIRDLQQGLPSEVLDNLWDSLSQ